MTLEIPVFYVKDKQAFSKKHGIMKMLGNPIHLARRLASEGTKLIHIIDEDAKKGMATNLDVYDKLTCFINIEVECGESEAIIEKLLLVKARVVLRLPGGLDLARWKEKKRLLAGIAAPDYNGDADGVHDVLLEQADEKQMKRFIGLGKRVILPETEDIRLKKQAFGALKLISQ